MHVLVVISLMAGLMLMAAQAEKSSPAELLRAAREAVAAEKLDEALRLASRAVDVDPKNPAAHLVRGTIHESLQKHAEAVADFDRVLALDPKQTEALNRRGSERFKLGQITMALEDFDRFVELSPKDAPGHWKRGIALYYAGRFEEGVKQFEAYEQVDTNDVENAVWHFLCKARASGVEKARASLLKIGRDQRVPMTEVYALFAGKAKPGDVLAAANAGQPSAELLNRQLFYAHLYLGLYHEVLGELGDRERAFEHLQKAADAHRVNHYMWDVARVHRDLLKEKK